ncbi:uncharacterized protein FOBCDRAFT_298389 [Fusarium oxysporum Fo47]|uniref:uncharacterized protein n=1 Tax=Fusarium oxysporum Fo47 TaxID=660027 RepID=UPI002869D119|nr:uncharacterized protein FOBCDRAFT_298389 [Fusarium oxysporum Fo47]WJG36128.1 hypothetical protein FOBCDRAFT_298389 [Fusarium oxysporum Fo47]
MDIVEFRFQHRDSPSTPTTDIDHVFAAAVNKRRYFPSEARSPRQEETRIQQKTYNSGDSLVVTDPTTNPPVSGLTMGERTGSRIFHYLWSYLYSGKGRCGQRMSAVFEFACHELLAPAKLIKSSTGCLSRICLWIDALVAWCGGCENFDGNSLETTAIIKLINSRIKGGSRNGLPLTALWQYDVFFQQSFCSCWTSPPPLHRLPSSSSLVLSDLRCKWRPMFL